MPTLHSHLCNYSDANIHVKRVISAEAGENRAIDGYDRYPILKNDAPFTNCILKINKVRIDNVEEFKAVTQKKNYSKTSSSLWKYSRDELVNPIKNSDSFKCKANIIVKSASGGNTKEAEFAVPLECLSNF